MANNKDSYGSQAEKDRFEVTSDWEHIAKEADILFLLVPDQVCVNFVRGIPNVISDRN